MGECEIIGFVKDRLKENGRIEKVIDIWKVKIIEIVFGLNKLNIEIVLGGKFLGRLIYFMKNIVFCLWKDLCSRKGSFGDCYYGFMLRFIDVWIRVMFCYCS